MIYRLKLPIITILIVASVAFALQFTVDNVYTQNWIQKEVNSYLEKNLKLRLKYNTISISITNPSASIYGIQVKNLKNDELALEASRVKITPYIIGFFLGIYKLDTLEIFDLKITLPITSEDAAPDTGLNTNQNPKIIWPPEWKIPTNKLILKNANISSKAPTASAYNQISYILKGLDLDLKWKNHRKWNAQISAKEFSFAYEDSVLISRAQLRTKLIADNDNSIKSETFSLISDRIDLNQNISINLDLKNEAFDPLASLRPKQFVENISITVEGEVKKADLKILGDFLKTDNTHGNIKGRTKFTMNIPTDMKNIRWQVDVNAKANNAILSGFNLLDSEFEMNITKDALFFNKIDFKEGNNSLAKATGKINFDDKVSMEYEANLQDIRLKKLLDILNVKDFEAFDANLAGKVKITGQSSPYFLAISGTPRLEQLHSPLIPTPAHSVNSSKCNISLQLYIDANQINFKDNTGVCFKQQSQQLKPRIKASKINLKGLISLQDTRDTNLYINLENTHPEFVSNFTPFKTTGVLNTKIHYHDSKKDSAVNIAIYGRDLTIEDEPFSNLAAIVSINTKNQEIHIEKFKLSSKDGNHVETNDSTVKYGESARFEGKVDIRKIPGTLIYDMLSIERKKARTSFLIHHFEGPLKLDIRNIRNTTASVKYDIRNLIFDNEILFESAEGFLEASEDTINLKVDRISQKSIQLKLNGSVKKEKTNQITDHPFLRHLGLSDKDSFAITLSNTIKPIDKGNVSTPLFNEINDLSSLPYVGKYFSQTKSSGDIDLDLTLEGKPNDIKGSFSGAIYNAFLFESPIASIYYSGFIDGSKINIPVIKHSGTSLIGRLNLDLSKPEIPYSWNFYLTQFDLRALLGKSFASDPRNYLYASASLNMNGKFNDWWNSSGSLEISEIAMNYTNDSFGKISQFKINSDEKIELVMTPDYWNFADNKALTIKSDQIDLRLSLVGNNPPSKIAAKIKTDFDIGLLKQLIPMIETAEGKVTLETKISQSINDPKIAITAKNYLDEKNTIGDGPSDLKVGIAGIPPSFDDIKFNLDYQNGLIDIKKFTASKGRQGSIKVAGQIVASPSKKKNQSSQVFVDFENIEINQIAYSIFQNTSIIASGGISLEGNMPPFKLSGDVNINKATSINDFDIRKEIVDTLYQSSSSSSTGPKKNLLNLDLSIKADNSLYIRNKNLEATLGGDMIIQGSEISPTIIGQITSATGTFNYKQKFELRRSVISFEDPSYPPNPNLDIVGQTNIDNYKVEVAISGPASEPQVDFTIDPATRSDGTPISKVDIIMLLTSGKLPNETNQSPIKIASSEALSLLVGFAEGPLEEIFDASGQSFIRQIYLDSYLSETESRPVTRLNLPVDINNELRVILQVDDDENFKLSSQYYLHENISVSGSFDKPKESKINESDRNLPTDTVLDLRFRFGFE